MALDGLFLYTIKKEIEDVAINSRIDKIYQPSKEEIVFSLRFRGGKAKLLISASANSPRVHFTESAPENPKSPPMFCMLLRKYLSTAKLIAVRQYELDRILFIDFETVNELGDMTVITVVCEIMGRHSNIILIDSNGKIIDSIKRISEDMSSVRLVLPGLKYELPPAQQKLNPFTTDRTKALSTFKQAKNQDFAKSILSIYQGVSPILARELAYLATGGLELMKNEVSDYRFNRLFDLIDSLKDQIEQNNISFCTAFENGKPKDFTLIDITQYGRFLSTKIYPCASKLLDEFYLERDRIERMRQRSYDLLKLLSNTTDRINRKLSAQSFELKQSADRDIYKICGDLINSYQYMIKKGERSITVQNYYDENSSDITIELDPSLSPSKNAQKYYNEYRKAKVASKKLAELIELEKQELLYLDSIFDALTRATGENELMEIREELSEQGYLKNYRNKNKQLKPLPPITYKSTDGFTILCGRNNKQNDKLTLKTAKNYDMWLHTQKIAGSHVIIVSDGKKISDTAIEQAAMIAAYNSNARESSKVPVDYCLARYVKKPVGAKPGMVIFTDYHTCYVTPNAEAVKSLLSN